MAFEIGDSDDGGYVLTADQLDELIDSAFSPRPAVAPPDDMAESSGEYLGEVRRVAENLRATGHYTAAHLMRDYAAALASRPVEAAQGGVPEGWKLVPLKSTGAMHRAYTRKKYERRDPESTLLIPELWEAMLAAAPEVK
jgi:hypothetical protein